ncbi:hypothetical protein J2T57_003650 [Natronocella acetinitrilica]|uniref:Uncharacterized protein n=1 Tax=Natronocella acetinitrilica TaxID=414046 RepID=A0AAE3KD61_9GAMM|nr:hypothetical protein [Natronocella acetinitrilica]MCP1676489.1 hypothetical protein [Natronocella acetinitrilica]
MRHDQQFYRVTYHEAERIRREAIELRNRAIGDAVRAAVRSVHAALDRVSFLSPNAQLRRVIPDSDVRT